MNEIKKGTWIRAGILLLALVNQVLVMVGKPPLSVSDEDFSMFLSIGLTLMASVWGFWKNNSFTQNAIKADEYKQELMFHKTEEN